MLAAASCAGFRAIGHIAGKSFGERYFAEPNRRAPTIQRRGPPPRHHLTAGALGQTRTVTAGAVTPEPAGLRPLRRPVVASWTRSSRRWRRAGRAAPERAPADEPLMSVTVITLMESAQGSRRPSASRASTSGGPGGRGRHDRARCRPRATELTGATTGILTAIKEGSPSGRRALVAAPAGSIEVLSPDGARIWSRAEGGFTMIDTSGLPQQVRAGRLPAGIYSDPGPARRRARAPVQPGLAVPCPRIGDPEARRLRRAPHPRRLLYRDPRRQRGGTGPAQPVPPPGHAGLPGRGRSGQLLPVSLPRLDVPQHRGTGGCALSP